MSLITAVRTGKLALTTRVGNCQMLVAIFGEPEFGVAAYSQGFVLFAALPVFATNCTLEPAAGITLDNSRIGFANRSAAKALSKNVRPPMPFPEPVRADASVKSILTAWPSCSVCLMPDKMRAVVI